MNEDIAKQKEYEIIYPLSYELHSEWQKYHKHLLYEADKTAKELDLAMDVALMAFSFPIRSFMVKMYT